MESVSDLPGLGRALARGLRIQTAAIAADDFDLRVLAEPFGGPRGCAILQHIDNLTPLQVDDNGPVSATFAPAPVVDAYHPYSRVRLETGDLPLQMPQNGVVADWHAKALHQPFTRPTASPVTEKMNKFSGPMGPTSVRTNYFWQLIRERLAFALPVETSPTAHLDLHHHGRALHREVLKKSEIPAVPTC
jgi:hypothetical protein